MSNFVNFVAVIASLIIGLAAAIAAASFSWSRVRRPKSRLLPVLTLMGTIIASAIAIYFSSAYSTPSQQVNSSTPTPPPIASPTPTPSPQPNYQSSDILPGTLLTITWDIPAIKEQAIIIKATIQPDSQAPLQDQFGSGYDFFIDTQLDASSFTINPQEQTQQSINEHMLTFIWTAIPNYTGRQALALTINGIWVPKGGGASIQRYLSNYSWYSTVLDNTPFFTLGQINFSTLLIAFLTPFISIPVWELVKRKRDAKSPVSPDTSIA